MSIPALEIPVRFQVGNVPGQLATVGAAGKKAGDDTAEGFDKATKGVQETGDAVATLMQAQMALGIMKQGAQAIGEEYKRTADYIQQMAKEFTVLQQAMQQVAALKGQDNSNQFTVGEAQKAAKVSLMPQEWIEFQERFQSYGGAYIEGEQNRFKEKDGVSAEDQAEQYQAKIAEFAKARKLGGGEAAQLGGALLQFAKGQQTTEGLMSKFGKVFKTLDKAPTPVAQLLPAMSRVMAQGMGAEEAAQALAIMSESSPGEEETHVRAALKGISGARMEGKGKELGLTEGMTRFQQLEAASKTLSAKQAGGADMEKVLKGLGFVDRELVGMMGFVNRGVDAEGFKRTKGYQTGTADDFTQTEVDKYRLSDSGQKARADADEAVSRAKRGAIHAGAELEIQRARTRRTESGEPEEPDIAGNALRNWAAPTSWLAGVGAEQQKINAEALGAVRRRAIDAGVKGVRSPGASDPDSLVTSQFQVNAEITELRKQTQLLTKIADAAKPPVLAPNQVAPPGQAPRGN